MKQEEILKLKGKDLGNAIEEQKGVLGNIKLKIALGEEKNTSLIKKSRKTIARMLTLANERDSHDGKK